MAKAHSAYKSWRVYFDRAIMKVVPALGKKSSAQFWFSIVMVIIAILSAIGIGIYADGYGLHPPRQFVGVCPPPAQIQKGGCYRTIVSVVTQGTNTRTVTQYQPAGKILLPNSTGGK